VVNTYEDERTVLYRTKSLDGTKPNTNFKYMSISSFVLVYKNLVRSHLDYCNCVWSPYRKADIETLKKVQKRATKILPKSDI